MRGASGPGGSLTTAGQVTAEYPLPNGVTIDEVAAVVLGPDGRITP